MRDTIVNRLQSAGPENLTRQEFRRDDGRSEFLKQRLIVRTKPEQMSGMNNGTSCANARRKSTFICSSSGSGLHSGSDDSTSFAPSWPPSIVLISLAAAVTIGSSVFDPLGYNHRFPNDSDPALR